MLDLICLGHASLLVRGGGATLLCDPIFGDVVSGGGNLIYPPRDIRAARIPPIDAVLISHHHSDHFCISELDRLRAGRNLRVLAPRGSPVSRELRERGYSLEDFDVGERIVFKGLTVTTTPSAVTFPEVGFLFECDGAAALNLVDTQIHGEIEAVCALVGRPALVLAPFQAGGYMSLLPLRVGGPPVGLDTAILQWSRQYLAELVDDVARFHPLHVAPFADGLVYRDAAINRWHFPLPDEAFLAALAARGIAGSIPRPGTRYEVREDLVQHRVDDTYVLPATEALLPVRSFDPACQISATPFRCGFDGPATSRISAAGVVALSQRLQSNLDLANDTLDQSLHRHMLDLAKRWVLELCDVADHHRFIVVEPRKERAVVELRADRPEGRPYGIRAHASDLLAVVEDRSRLEYIKLGGAFRYFSPREVDNLESIRERVFLPFDALLEPKSMTAGARCAARSAKG